MPTHEADTETAIFRIFRVSYACENAKTLFVTHRTTGDMLAKVPGWNDRAIAAHVGVSQPFVGKIREEMTDNGYQSDERTGLDGRTIKTANIGRLNPSNSTEVNGKKGETEGAASMKMAV